MCGDAFLQDWESYKRKGFGGGRKGDGFSEKLHSICPSRRFSKNISQVMILRCEILDKGTYFTAFSPKLPK